MDKTRTFAFLLCSMCWIVGFYLAERDIDKAIPQIFGALHVMSIHWYLNSKYRLSS